MLLAVVVPVFDVLLLKVLQSVEVKAPVVDALAVAIDIVVEPVPVLLDDIGDEPDTLVTPDDELVPAPISDLTSAPVIPDARDGVEPLLVMAAFEPVLLTVNAFPERVILISVPFTKFIVSPALIFVVAPLFA